MAYEWRERASVEGRVSFKREIHGCEVWHSVGPEDGGDIGLRLVTAPFRLEARNGTISVHCDGDTDADRVASWMRRFVTQQTDAAGVLNADA